MVVMDTVYRANCHIMICHAIPCQVILRQSMVDKLLARLRLSLSTIVPLRPGTSPPSAEAPMVLQEARQSAIREPSIPLLIHFSPHRTQPNRRAARPPNL
jgi:hypothetical protein